MNFPDGKWAENFYRQTVIDNPYLRGKTATPPQFNFLTRPAKEILYGGSAGSGKSAALLMAALQFVMVPGYAALILRRSFADLTQPKALIPLSLEWLSQTNARFNAQEHRWYFPTGATLSFGYLETEQDKYQYQGAAFQACFFDELTQFRESQYTYLYSRLRRTEDMAVTIPLRMRAATNPGGVGHEWVKKRFIDRHDVVSREFIPAKLEDNPYLDKEAYTESLMQLDPITRAQLLNGDWDVMPSSIFKQDWFRSYKVKDGRYILLQIDGSWRSIGIEDCWRFSTMDVAGTEKAKSASGDPDYTVIQVWDITPTYDMILVDQVRGQWEIPDVEDRAMEFAARMESPWTGIEGAAMGMGVIQSLRRRGMAIRTLPTKGKSKVVRSQTAQLRMEAGTIYFPLGRPWVEALTDELLRFDGLTGHDDQVDTLAYAAIHCQKMGGPIKKKVDDVMKVEAEKRLEKVKTYADQEILAAQQEARARAYDPRDMWVGFNEED